MDSNDADAAWLADYRQAKAAEAVLITLGYRFVGGRWVGREEWTAEEVGE